MKKRCLLYFFATIVLLLPLSATEMISIAVLEFENHTGDKRLEHLKHGIQGMITTDITRIPDIIVVERVKLNRVLQEINFNQTQYVDKSNAAKIGKLLSASYLLTGAYFTDQNKIRIDVRLINTEKGMIVYTDKVEGVQDDFFKLEHQLISAILKNMKPSITERELEYLRKLKEANLTPAEMFSKAIFAFSSLTYPEAIKWLRKSAEQDFPPAQYYYGYCYHDGLGVKQDYTKAVKWFYKAAQQGHADAQTNLGCCYAAGTGIRQDYNEAIKWYRKAAEQGDPGGQYNLGWCYFSGHGVKSDYAEAVKWYRKAAEQGNVSAQFNLAVCYATGQGVKQDSVEAVKWFRKSAEQGLPDAQYNLGVYYATGQGVEQDYNEAIKWYRKAAEQGDPGGQYNLGWCYFSGHGVKSNYAEAVKWYRKAAEQGNVSAQLDLAVCYATGQGVKQDYVEAVKWYRKAAEQGLSDAQNNLARCYATGQGVKQDDAEAAKWYRKSAEQGNVSAQLDLAVCYDAGRGVERNLCEALKWYRKVADTYKSMFTKRYDSDVIFNLAEIFIIIGEYDQALACLSHPKLQAENTAKAQCLKAYLSACALLAKGNDAEAEIRQFNKSFPDYAKILDWSVGTFRIWLKRAKLSDQARTTITELTDRIDGVNRK